MSDIICPYCGHEQNADGDFTEPEELHETKCTQCEKIFGVYVDYMPCYDTVKLPCYNGESHKFNRVARFPRIIAGNELYRCEWCEETKNVAVPCNSRCTDIDKYGNYNCTECDVWR